MAFNNRNQRLNGFNPLAYLGDNAYQPSEFVTNNRAPTTNDTNFELGTNWLYTNETVTPNTETMYILVNLDRGIAKWVSFAGGSGDLLTLTANSGGTVSPDVNGNINVIGDTTTVNIVGTPGTNTLTASTTGAVAVQYNEDSGSAIPALGILQVKGGTSTNGIATNVNTRGSTNLVEVCLNNTINLPNTNSAGAGQIQFGSAIFMHNYGVLNTFVGRVAGNTTLTTGMAVQNLGFGDSALTSLTTGSNNVGVGNGALMNDTTGAKNIGVGQGSLGSLTTTSSNTAVGWSTLSTLVTGAQNIAIGDSSGSTYVGAESSNILINSIGVVAESNVIRIGTTGGGAGQQAKCWIAAIRGVTTDVNDAIPVLIDSTGQLGTTSSSIRFKENVKDMASSSDDLMRLRPVTFNYKKDLPTAIQFGLIAEEVEKVMPKLVVHEKTGEPYTVKYNDLPAMLLNEIQKLNKRIEKLEQQKCCK